MGRGKRRSWAGTRGRFGIFGASWLRGRSRAVPPPEGPPVPARRAVDGSPGPPGRPEGSPRPLRTRNLGPRGAAPRPPAPGARVSTASVLKENMCEE
ncbi:unnamed protein product [Pipistrellus nathusii]|uniref:Uncharacterized protein n=1 Tax=Pipistrellus nathusii TaxID=59473 RepID=A0ABP0A2S4_PIPNA